MGIFALPCDRCCLLTHQFSSADLPPILVPRNHGEALPPHSEILASNDELSGTTANLPPNANLPLDLDEMDLFTTFSEIGSPTLSAADGNESNDELCDYVGKENHIFRDGYKRNVRGAPSSDGSVCVFEVHLGRLVRDVILTKRTVLYSYEQFYNRVQASGRPETTVDLGALAVDLTVMIKYCGTISSSACFIKSVLNAFCSMEFHCQGSFDSFT